MNTSTITVSVDGSSQSTQVTTQVTMPFQGSFWGTPLPANATIDTTNGPACVNDLVSRSKINKPNLNVNTWTAEHIIAPAGTPLVPVSCASGDSHLNSALAEGVPIPAGTVPTNDSDSALTIWQPSTGKYWELQAAHQNPTTGAWSANFGGRAGGVNSATRLPHYVNYVTGPAGTYEAASWGTQGSGLPYWPGVLTLNDCKRSSVNHALLLEVYDARSGGHVWPCSRSDGGAGSSNQDYPVIEGQRLRFPAGYQIPTTVHPLCQLIIQGIRDYGCVITDRTLYDLSMRATPSVGAAGYLGSTADYDVLTGFPWQDLQLLAVGSDTAQTPTS